VFNDRDLKMKLKVNTFGDDNYDQIENFVEYEKYLQRSYFAAVQRTVNHQVEVFRNFSSAKDLFTDLKEEIPVQEMTYTMDLNVVIDKYSAPLILEPELLPGEQASTFADIIFQEITEKDPV
jgi:hypothetical protein